jgi:hypothetical protein
MTEHPAFGTVTLDDAGAPVCQTIIIRNEFDIGEPTFMARCLGDKRNAAPAGCRRHWIQHWQHGRLAWVELIFTVDSQPKL